MRHVNKILGGLVVALFLSLGFYAAGYLLMLDSAVRLDHLFEPGPHYRWQDEQLQTFFTPAHAIDRKLRPERRRILPLFL